MKFDHDYIEKNEILIKYLLHQLSKEETDKFEEHLLFCSECRANIQKTSKVIDNIYSASSEIGINKIKEASGISNNKTYFNFKFLYKIAASVIILISIGACLYILFNKDQGKIYNEVSEIIPVDTLKANERDIFKSDINEPVHKQIIASLEYDSILFKESLFFEKIIKDVTRGSDIQIDSPEMGQKFKYNSEVVFKWEGASGEVFLTVFNNKDQLVFEQKAISPYIFPEKLEQGLYYWQLENEEYSLYTGKFLVK